MLYFKKISDISYWIFHHFTRKLHATKKNRRGKLPIPALTKQARMTFFCPQIIVSKGQLYNNKSTFVLNKESVLTIKHKNAILKGTQSTFGDDIWDISVPKVKVPQFLIISLRRSLKTINLIFEKRMTSNNFTNSRS